MTRTQLMPSMQSRLYEEWRVQVENRSNSDSAIDPLILRQKMMSSNQPPHLSLAPSQDWLALGKAKLATKDVEGAIACAQAGLEELGSAYLVPLIRDDTEIKLLLAEERLQEGHLEDAAQMMLRILESRLLLYATLRKTLGMEEAME
ncbi:MAG: hypothetical protein ACPGWR_06970 [Ardenticatenaceae bacterium]